MKTIDVIHKGRASKVNVNVKSAEAVSYEEMVNDFVCDTNVDKIVAELREVSNREFREIFAIAKQYRKADRMLDKYLPVMRNCSEGEDD